MDSGASGGGYGGFAIGGWGGGDDKDESEFEKRRTSPLKSKVMVGEEMKMIRKIHDFKVKL